MESTSGWLVPPCLGPLCLHCLHREELSGDLGTEGNKGERHYVLAFLVPIRAGAGGRARVARRGDIDCVLLPSQVRHHATDVITLYVGEGNGQLVVGKVVTRFSLKVRGSVLEQCINQSMWSRHEARFPSAGRQCGDSTSRACLASAGPGRHRVDTGPALCSSASPLLGGAPALLITRSAPVDAIA